MANFNFRNRIRSGRISNKRVMPRRCPRATINLKIHQSAGHNEGVIGTLEYDVTDVNGGLRRVLFQMVRK